MINALRTAELKAKLVQPKEITNEDAKENAPQEDAPEKKVLKSKMCPKCGKVKAYYFHVKNCRP